MNFEIDDALGSDDSFFEEPKALSKRLGTKTVAKKSVENLFDLTDVKENVDTTKNISNVPPKVKNVVTFDETTIKHDEFTKQNISDFSNKVQKKKNDDWLGEPENIGVQEKKSKKSDFLEDLLSGRPVSPKEKNIASSEDIRKDSQFSSLTKTSVKDSSTPTDVLSNFSLLSNTSRDRRRARRGSSSGFEDALGLLGDDYQSGDFYSKEPKSNISKTSTVEQSKPTFTDEKGIPDWLGGSSYTSGHIETDFPKKVDETVKNDIVKDLQSNAVEENKQKKSSNIVENSKEYDVQLNLKQQQINLDLHNTYSSLQQQETFLLISLQLKKYEENLEAIKRQQQEILEKQEKRFDSILDRYAVRQQMIENNIRLQQERLNNHIQMLISQPISNTEKIHSTESGNSEEINSHEGTNEIRNLILSLKQKHNEEIFVMEESYKKQISLLEKSSDALEERLKNEMDHVISIYDEKIITIGKNYNEEISFYKQKINTLEEQQNKDMQLIKEHHSRILEEVREEYESHIEHLKSFIKKDNDLLTDGQFYSQKLSTGIEMLQNNNKLLQEVQEKIARDSDVISIARLNSMETREKEIILMRNTLEKSREAAENERSQLLALIRTLETKIAEQNINAQEDRWALQQAAATISARSAALDREQEYNRNVNEREREQLKTLKESMLAEQEKMILQITEEKLKLSAEKSRIETSNKLSNNYESEKIKSEAEMAIQVAKDLSQKVMQEREFLYRQKHEIETFKRELTDRERELQDKEINLEYLMENTQRKIHDDKKIINEAKKLELKYKERLQELQNQWASLADREKKLAEEKVLLSKERLALYTTMKQSKTCVLCKGNDLPIPSSNYFTGENLPILKTSDTSTLKIRLDAVDDEGSSEVSKEENNIS